MPLHSGARDLQDDCAVFQFGDETLVVSSDSMAENIHFDSAADMADVAWKLVASNLSDLASCGAQPIGVLLNYTLSSNRADKRFAEGLNEALTAHKITLIGGDTIRNDRIILGMTAIGIATFLPVPDRRKAKPGDLVYVTGMLGCAMLGFEGNSSYLGAFNRPKPRIAEGKAIAPFVNAMTDISDGLLLDGFRLASASNVSIHIDSSSVPVADPKRKKECLSWGDDYELLFTVPPHFKPPITCSRIGEITQRNSAPLIVDGNAIEISDGLGYEH